MINCVILHAQIKKNYDAFQLDAELFRQLSIIAEDEVLMTKMLKYAKKLAAIKKSESTQLAKEEIIAEINNTEQK